MDKTVSEHCYPERQLSLDHPSFALTPRIVIEAGSFSSFKQRLDIITSLFTIVLMIRMFGVDMSPSPSIPGRTKLTFVICLSLYEYEDSLAVESPKPR